MTVVSVTACEAYELDLVRRTVVAALAPMGGMDRFVEPGMQVLLKPNLLLATDLERAVTTHPMVVQAVAELVQEAGGRVWIGDSPAGPVRREPSVWRRGGMAGVAERTGARLVPFEGVEWKPLNGNDYFLARPILEADLVINLPKLKTHSLTLYTGAVKNLFGAIPGTRKREIHYRAPGVQDFSVALADVLELVPTGLTIMDGIVGQEGSGPGVGGTPHHYGCLLASRDGVALDSVVTRAMGYRPGDVMHLTESTQRGLGICDLEEVEVKGDAGALEFGKLDLPSSHWYLRIPSWMAAPIRRVAERRPLLHSEACIGCGRCVEVCPRDAITVDETAHIDLNECVSCLCCAEICPQGAIEPHQGLLGRLLSSF